MRLEKNRNISLPKRIMIYVVVSLFLVFEMAVQVSPSVMAPQLMRDFGIGAFALGMMSSVYFYSYTAMQLPSGLLFDRFPPKLIIVSSIIVCVTGTLLFSIATNFYMACLARLLMGLGSAFAFISVLVVASDMFKAKHFAMFAGLTQMLAAFGAMLGQTPINGLVNIIGWHKTMLLLSAFGLVLAVSLVYLLNYQHERKKTLYVTTNWLERTKKDLTEIVRNRQNWYVAGYACLLWAPMSGFASLWGVSFLIHFDQLSTNQAAFISSMMWIGLALASPLLGILSHAINKVLLLWFSALLGAVAFGALLFMHLSIIELAISTFLAGAACAGQALSFAVVKQNNSSQVKSTSMALNNMAIVLSGALFQPIIGRLIDTFQHISLSLAYQVGCSVIFAAYLIGFIVALTLIDAKYKDSHVYMLKHKVSEV